MANSKQSDVRMGSRLSSGTKLGRYEIRSKIGEGGMGEVYRARDEKLNRDVAIKVLPATLSQNTDRLRRFEQEAQAAGALNHPNILAVYDVGTHDGAPYVVSELLEGESLKERLGDGPLAQRKTIDYAVQIAHGLAAAHGKGIVHRDLKPDNLFITKDDRVKILDFGLAKLIEPVGEGVAQTEIATRKVQTDPGTVMGTVGYMSPEQVRGRHVDHRSDIFSFGAVLYEMLCGQRAFHGDSAVETLNAILKEEPPELTATNRNIAPALERVVWHCLEKSPERRFQSATDVAFALESLSGSSGVSSQTLTAIAALPARLRIVKHLPWIVAGVLLVALLPFVIAYFRRAPTPEPHASRFFVFPPEKSTFTGGGQFISPDGLRLVFRATGADGKSLLWMRALDSLAAQPLPGTEEGAAPFWSPDSRSIGFFVTGGKLKKIDVTGGPAQTLADTQAAAGGTWNRDGVIVFARSYADRLYRMPAAGGAPTPVTTLDESRKETAHLWPYFLPDGRHFLYFARSGQRENYGIYVGSLDSKETRFLVNTDASAAYAPPGFLLFLRERTLMAQPFDASKLQLTGEPFPIAEQVGYNAGIGRALFSVSETGVLVFLSNIFTNTQLAWFDRGGKPLAQVGTLAQQNYPRLSPDEKRLAVSRGDPQAGSGDIWLIDLARNNTPSRFTFDPANDTSPIWSPDGSRIVFASNRDGTPNLYQRLSSSAGNDEALFKSSEPKLPNDWSPDGRFILYNSLSPNTGTDLWVLPLSGDQKPTPFVQTEFTEYQGRFSPDGRWVAYASNLSGTYEVYVQSFPSSGGKWQISTGGGAQPQWRRDGKELFYLAPDRKLMAVEVNGAGATFVAGVPKPLFEAHVSAIFPGIPCYAVTSDGQRFLVNTLVGESAPAPLTVVMNWTADLKK
jgi:Tol biopolymer transport system component/tRNA A-37 threonylcarbamoyl transferase component Bud32